MLISGIGVVCKLEKKVNHRIRPQAALCAKAVSKKRLPNVSLELCWVGLSMTMRLILSLMGSSSEAYWTGELLALVVSISAHHKSSIG